MFNLWQDISVWMHVFFFFSFFFPNLMLSESDSSKYTCIKCTLLYILKKQTDLVFSFVVGEVISFYYFLSICRSGLLPFGTDNLLIVNCITRKVPSNIFVTVNKLLNWQLRLASVCPLIPREEDGKISWVIDDIRAQHIYSESISFLNPPNTDVTYRDQDSISNISKIFNFYWHIWIQHEKCQKGTVVWAHVIALITK